LQVEPILGKKRLDLLKLFNIVMDIGGFDKVKRIEWEAPLLLGFVYMVFFYR
jgi:hypothetical protein